MAPAPQTALPASSHVRDANFIRRYLRKLLTRLGAPGTCRLKVIFADGSLLQNAVRSADGEITLVFKNSSAERRTLFYFPDGLIESWISEDIDILGDRPIGKLAELAHRAFAPAPDRMMPVNPLLRARQILQERRTNNKDIRQAKRNAEFHYAIDRRFFEHMLGPTLGYSEGYWAEGTRTLDQAKHNNYEYICRKLRLEPGERVVEVGSGWGYMPILMAKKFGVHVTVYNPVKAQNDFMRVRFEAQGVAAQIRILEKDHREIAQESGAYDKFVSIGVQEHCGRDCYREWIGSIAKALTPGGMGVISTTSLMHKEFTNLVITRHIFPGGHIPSLPLMLQIMDECGLSLIDVECLWPHYQRTLQCWLQNFETAWPDIHKLDPAFFSEGFRRAWSSYLEGTIENFGYALDLSHITFTNGRGTQYYGLHREKLLDQAEFLTGEAAVTPLR